MALWSPKVLRAGMGAHFALRLIESMLPEALDVLQLPFIATSSHATKLLHEADLHRPLRVDPWARRARASTRP